MDLTGLIYVKLVNPQFIKTHEKCTTSDRSLFLNTNRPDASNLFGKSSLLEFLPA